jgi:hypothetical protein
MKIEIWALPSAWALRCKSSLRCGLSTAIANAGPRRLSTNHQLLESTKNVDSTKHYFDKILSSFLSISFKS